MPPLNVYSQSKKKTLVKQNVDNRGNLETSFFNNRGKKTKINEPGLKAKFSTGNYDHSMIQGMRVEQKSLIEVLLEKQAQGIKLKKSELIILNNALSIKKDLIENDLSKLEEKGIVAIPVTEVGKLTKLLMIVDRKLLKTNLTTTEKEDIYYVYRKIIKYTIPDDIKLKFKPVIDMMNKVINSIDLITIQFTRFHYIAPPADNKGFTKLDPWQKLYLDMIEVKKNIIVLAKTSAGKSVLASEIFANGKINAIVCVPTDPLCWQSASMIGNITKLDIPIVTQTYQSEFERDELIKKIEKTGIVVGTPQYLNDILPFIKINFSVLLIDEIHMMGKEISCEMELLCKVYCNIQTIVLSATIGNVDELQQWFYKIGYKEMNIITCDKRFITLQKFFFNKSNELERIHPLSSISIEDVKDGKILTRTFEPTLPDILILANDLLKYVKLDKLEPTIYFKRTQIITLDEAHQYFNYLLEWMVNNYSTHETSITKIINSYKHNDLDTLDVNLYDVATHLRSIDKLPALFFQTDTHKCLELARLFSRTICDKEDETHPRLLKERLKDLSMAKNKDKELEKLKIDKMKDKQIHKLMMAGTFENNCSTSKSLYEPHPDFTFFVKHQNISQYDVEQWSKDLKFYFPSNGSKPHYIIDLLSRGVGIYVKGLPANYLHIVQHLACSGKLGIVFSDDSLVFGVSMPFKTSVITHDINIDTMMFHQMAGRAGRRGLDREGIVLFVGYTWNDILKLSTNVIPVIKGCDTMFYGSSYAEMLSKDKRWGNIKKNFLNPLITNEDADAFYANIEENISPDGGWDFAYSDDINFIHMCWRLRHSPDCFSVPFLLKHIRKIFHNCNPSNENTQVEFTHLLLNFIDIYPLEIDDKDIDNTHILLPSASALKYNIHAEYDEYFSDNFKLPVNIDSRVYESIQRNSIIDTRTTKDKSIIRMRLYNFAEKVKIIQHYFFHSKDINIARVLSKLHTRLYWIYHMSSPAMDSISAFIVPEEEEEEDEKEEEVDEKEEEVDEKEEEEKTSE